MHPHTHLSKMKACSQAQTEKSNIQMPKQMQKYKQIQRRYLWKQLLKKHENKNHHIVKECIPNIQCLFAVMNPFSCSEQTNQTFMRNLTPISFNVLVTYIMCKSPSRCVLLSSMSCFTSSFSVSTQVLAWFLSGPRGPPLRTLQAVLSCLMRAGSSRASDRPPQVTGGVLSGPQTGECGASSEQTLTSTPTPRPESRTLTSEPQSPSNTGILTALKDRWVMDKCAWKWRWAERRGIKKKQRRTRDGRSRSSLSGSHTGK